MWWKRKQNTEWLPWYRVPGFKGQVSEVEKRKLDAFRMLDRHPAASYQDLPEEVQTYISRLTVEIYNFKQENAVSGPLLAGALGAAILGVSYFGVHFQPTESIWPYAFGLLLLIVPWFVYRREWQRNADEFLPRDGPNRIDESIKEEWELDYLFTLRNPKDGSKT